MTDLQTNDNIFWQDVNDAEAIGAKVRALAEEYPDITDEERARYVSFLKGETDWFVFRCRVQ